MQMFSHLFLSPWRFNLDRWGGQKRGAEKSTQPNPTIASFGLTFSDRFITPYDSGGEETGRFLLSSSEF